jgi:hypothetical protein
MNKIEKAGVLLASGGGKPHDDQNQIDFSQAQKSGPTAEVTIFRGVIHFLWKSW